MLNAFAEAHLDNCRVKQKMFHDPYDQRNARARRINFGDKNRAYHWVDSEGMYPVMKRAQICVLQGPVVEVNQ